MGEHKHNPTAISAKNGELPPKPKKMGKKETDRYLYGLMRERLLYHLMRGMDAMEVDKSNG